MTKRKTLLSCNSPVHTAEIGLSGPNLVCEALMEKAWAKGGKIFVSDV